MVDIKRKIGWILIGLTLVGISIFVSYRENADNSPETVLASNELSLSPVPKTVYQGKVPILLYHSIGMREARWTRSVVNFKKDLQWLYDNGYILFSIEDFVDSRYDIIPEGKKPVIITFDDGKSSQFRYLTDGTIDPNCAVGLLDAFYKDHVDFGRAAVFYVNAYPFGQTSLINKKMEYLISTGRQIGFHTLNHNNMRTLSPAQNQYILLKQAETFQKILPTGTRVDTLSYPHGLTPAGGLKAINTAQKDGISYNIKLGLMIGSGSALQLTDSKSNAYRTPRIQAIDSEWLRLFKRNVYAF